MVRTDLLLVLKNHWYKTFLRRQLSFQPVLPIIELGFPHVMVGTEITDGKTGFQVLIIEGSKLSRIKHRLDFKLNPNIKTKMSI